MRMRMMMMMIMTMMMIRRRRRMWFVIFRGSSSKAEWDKNNHENADENTCLNAPGSLEHMHGKLKVAKSTATASNDSVRSHHSKKGIGNFSS